MNADVNKKSKIPIRQDVHNINFNARPISIDARLTAAAKLIPSIPGRLPAIADIGADHGKLSAYALQNGLCSHSIISDISMRPLERARRLCEKLQLLGSVDIICADGLAALLNPVDAVVICGMGGQNIIKILGDGAKLSGAAVIAQANIESAQLRKHFMTIGYKLDAEELVTAGGRMYIVMRAVPGAMQYENWEYYAGPILSKTRPELYKKYAERRIRIAKKALHGRQQADILPDTPEACVLREEIAAWQKIFNNE